MADFLRSFSRIVFLFGVGVLLAVIPFSKYVLSVGQFVIAGAWVVERFDTEHFIRMYHQNKSVSRAFFLTIPWVLSIALKGIISGFAAFWRNKPALIFSSILLLHLLGLIYTTDFEYGMKDIRTKLPLFLLPLFMSTSFPICKKGFRNFMLIFVLALTIGTIINMIKIHYYQYADLRVVARHVSHIILGLLIVLSLFVQFFYLFRDRTIPLWGKSLIVLNMVWQLTYLFITQSFTGIAVLILTFLVLAPILIFRKKNPFLKGGLILVMLVVTVSITIFLFRVVRDFYTVKSVDFTRLERFTPRGNLYTHNIAGKQMENGNPVWIYIQMDEMREAWNERSNYKFDDLNRKGEVVAFTLIRFLASKDLRRDADGVNALSDEEIRAIEKGIPNVIWLDPLSLRGRIYELLWGYEHYRETGDPTGLTLMQRIEFWKASTGIIRQNWLFGVGTGDMNIAFQAEYERMQSKLAPEQRWRSHNQFLSIWVGLGLIGLVWFLFAIFYPSIRLKRLNDYFFLTFLVIALLSMLTEDTIESQTGLTFFTLFYSLFLFYRHEPDPI